MQSLPPLVLRYCGVLRLIRGKKIACLWCCLGLAQMMMLARFTLALPFNAGNRGGVG